jgi:hypothetical protein
MDDIFLREFWEILQRLQGTLREFRAINKQSLDFLKTAYKVEVEAKPNCACSAAPSANVKVWLKRAEEARALADKVDERGRGALLEIASTYEAFAAEAST